MYFHSILNIHDFGIIIAAHSLSASDGTSAVGGTAGLEPEPESEPDLGLDLESELDSVVEVDLVPELELYPLGDIELEGEGEEEEEEEEEGGEREEDDEGEKVDLEGTSYSLLRISVGTDPFVMQPSPSHHFRNALQCLSYRRVEESPTTTKPDRARVTKYTRK